MNVFIKRDRFGMKWSESINTNYQYFDNHVKNY